MPPCSPLLAALTTNTEIFSKITKLDKHKYAVHSNFNSFKTLELHIIYVALDLCRKGKNVHFTQGLTKLDVANYSRVPKTRGGLNKRGVRKLQKLTLQ